MKERARERGRESRLNFSSDPYLDLSSAKSLLFDFYRVREVFILRAKICFFSFFKTTKKMFPSNKVKKHRLLIITITIIIVTL